jgi:hypothetical protein
MQVLESPFSEPQLDLLRMFSHSVDDADWVEIKKMIVAYFAKKTVEEANRIWDEQGWNDDKVNELLNSHLRTPYQKP